MGRDQGPLVARYGLMPGIAVALVLLLAGCGGHANVQGSANNGAASAAVSFPGRASLGTLLTVIILAGISYESDREMERTARFPHTSSLPGSPYAPDLDPSRRVLEHDCTKPIEDWSANLRCR